jgi:hypothetical protein
MDIEWALAHPLHDVEDIVEMADKVFGKEVDGILTTNRAIFRKNVTMASVYQQFDRSREFLAVARPAVISGTGEYSNKLLGFCWFDRGGYTTYASEEISNAKFHHVDLSLPLRTRVKLLNAMIDQHILWANNNGIPVICSTSIRGDHKGFMKLHEKRGFTVTGSYAWIRTKEGLNGIKNSKATNI